MVKKVTAPRSYDPGKGRPQEYLAYLNQREMAYLRSLNGNNMERGPRGLPSFPPDDAIGSSSNAGSKGPGGPSGPNSGPSGGGSNLGGGSKGPGGPSGPNSGPSGGGNLGGGNKGGPGGPSGPNSSSGNLGGGSKGPGGPSGPNSSSRSPSSPMGGQGSSFSTPSGAASYNADRSVQQRAQVNDARNAVRNSPAARSDLAVGGIRSLSVGPMGTTVNVGRPISSGMSFTGPSTAGKISRSISEANKYNQTVAGGWGVMGYGAASPKVPNYASPTTAPPSQRPADAERIQRELYGATKQFYDRVPASGKQIGELGAGYDERIPASIDPRGYSPYGMNVPDVVKTPTTGISVSGGLGIAALPGSGAPLSKTSFDGDDDFLKDFREGQSGIDSLGDLYDANNTSTGVPGPETPRKDYVQGINGPNSLPIGTNDLYGPFAPEKIPTEPRDASIFSNSFVSPAAAATPEAEEKILEVEDFYRGRPTWAAETYTSPYDVTSTAKKSKPIGDRLVTVNGVTREVTAAQMNKMTPEDQKKLADSLQEVTYTPPEGLRSAAGTWTESYDVPLNEKPRSAAGTWTESYDVPTGEETENAEPDVRPEGEVQGPKFVDPEIQELMRDIDEKNRRGVKVGKMAPGVGRVLSIADTIRGIITGKTTTEADADLKRAYMQASPAQRAELERRNPNLTKFAQMAGVEPQLPMSNYENWRQRSFGTGGGGTSGGITSLGGNRDDIGSGGKNEPRFPNYSDEPDVDKKKKEKNYDGSRPAIYYKWDLGIDIPSPGDSDYTLYIQYLQEKAAAEAENE